MDLSNPLTLVQFLAGLCAIAAFLASLSVGLYRVVKKSKIDPFIIVSGVQAIFIILLLIFIPRQITTVSLTPTPTPTAYPPPNWKLVRDDPLTTSIGAWQEGSSSDGKGSCTFTANAYQVSALKRSSGYGCFAANIDLTDFAFEVQMTIVKGYQGGMAFRSNPNAQLGNEYYIHISRGGTYELDIYENYQPSKTLISGASTAIHTGFNQPNVVAVVAKGNTITLYVNHQQIATVNDSTYSHGRIGLTADTDNNPLTEVLYSNAKVWTPT